MVVRLAHRHSNFVDNVLDNIGHPEMLVVSQIPSDTVPFVNNLSHSVGHCNSANHITTPRP